MSFHVNYYQLLPFSKWITVNPIKDITSLKPASYSNFDSIFERCPSQRESTEMNKERQESLLGVRFNDVSYLKEVCP